MYQKNLKYQVTGNQGIQIFDSIVSAVLQLYQKTARTYFGFFEVLKFIQKIACRVEIGVDMLPQASKHRNFANFGKFWKILEIYDKFLMDFGNFGNL